MKVSESKLLRKMAIAAQNVPYIHSSVNII